MCRAYVDKKQHWLKFCSESPLVLCGIIPTVWLEDNMVRILLQKPGGGHGWSKELGTSLMVSELRALLKLKFKVN